MTTPARLRAALTERVPTLVWDVLLGAFFTLLVVLDLCFPHGDDGYTGGPTWLNVPLTLMMAAPLVTRHVAPRASFAVMIGAAVLPAVFVAHTVYFWANFLPIGIMVYTLARATDRWPAGWAWATGFALAGALDLHLPASRGLGNIAFSGGLYLIAWIAGRTMRRFDAQGRALSNTLAALTDEQAAREEFAVASERARIAVEMHDVVAHAVSLMVVQVGATRMELERDGSTQPRLRTAEQTGREALVELRRTLGVLRLDPVDLHPQPGLGSVPALVQGFRDAGLDVELRLDPVVVASPGAELAAYRILQEALTNALKHGGTAPVTASIVRSEDNLVLDVANQLPLGNGAAREWGTRNGLAGMRERAAMFSGTLWAGRAHGRFEVHAVLPVADNRPMLEPTP